MQPEEDPLHRKAPSLQPLPALVLGPGQCRRPERRHRHRADWPRKPAAAWLGEAAGSGVRPSSQHLPLFGNLALMVAPTRLRSQEHLESDQENS